MSEPIHPDPILLRQAVDQLRRGQLVIMPTETVYGLAADASNPLAVRAIFALKGRPMSRPLIVHLASAAALDQWARDIPDEARTLAERYWPGPLTLVLPRSARVPDAVTAGQDTVALRVPSHPVALNLLREFGGGLAAPSANRYGHLSPTTADHVRGQFGDQTPLLLDGGPCEVGIESTIVACLNDGPKVLRPGVITAEAISHVLQRPVRVQVDGTTGDHDVRVPGQTTWHYAPRTPSYLLPRDQVAPWTRQRTGRGGFLGFEPPPVPIEMQLRLERDPDAAAQRLYAALHELDQAELDWIVIEALPESEAWRALRDRLTRATARPADGGPTAEAND